MIHSFPTGLNRLVCRLSPNLVYNRLGLNEEYALYWKSETSQSSQLLFVLIAVLPARRIERGAFQSGVRKCGSALPIPDQLTCFSLRFSSPAVEPNSSSALTLVTDLGNIIAIAGIDLWNRPGGRP